VTTERTSVAARRVLDACRARGWKLATVESCTGGLVVAALTDVAGSSEVVDRGFVTYSNAAKETMIGVPHAIIEAHGAVSEPTAMAMAKGALDNSSADVSVAVTGIAGPGGGSAGKPVGLVYFAAATRDGRVLQRQQRYGDIGRAQVRERSVVEALSLLELLAGAEG
jgi:nicotinamide-nucleotide amidase